MNIILILNILTDINILVYYLRFSLGNSIFLIILIDIPI